MIIILNNDKFGKRLRTVRQKLGISRASLARECGISVYRLRRLENGEILEIENSLFQAICTVLARGVEELLDLETVPD